MLGLIAFPVLTLGLLAFAIFDDDDSDISDEAVDPGTPDTPTSVEDIVTVTDGTGAEVSDDTVIFPGRDIAFDTPADNVVTPPDGPNDVIVSYDPDITVVVEPNAETQTVDIHLNTSVDGVDGTPVTAQSEALDDNGDTVTTISTTYDYASAMDITLNVDPGEIGNDVSYIDLTNPNDTLHLEFGDGIAGNFHLVRFSENGGTGASSATQDYAYVVRTDPDITEIPRADYFSVLFEDAESANLGYGYDVLAEVYLGATSRSVDPFDTAGPSTVRISDDLNDDPVITTNLEWASITQYS